MPTVTMCVRIRTPLLSGEAERGTLMPQVRKLAPEEVKTIENKGKGQRKLTEELYDSILSEYEVGDYGEATLDEGEKRLTVRNRLKAAAGRRNVGVEFRRTNGDLIRFYIVAQGNGQSAAQSKPMRRVPEPEYAPEPITVATDAAPKRRGGRPKKNSEEVVAAPAKRKGGRPKKSG